MKTIFPGRCISIMNIRQSWYHLILWWEFLLVRQHLCIERPHACNQSIFSNTQTLLWVAQIRQLNVKYTLVFCTDYHCLHQQWHYMPDRLSATGSVKENMDGPYLHNSRHPFQYKDHLSTGLTLRLRPANERRRYFVTTSLIGWAQTYNQPCFHIHEIQ